MTVKYGLEQDLIISEETVLDYHNRCIAHLRFLASEPDAIMDENLLAAVVVLRFYEELDSTWNELCHPPLSYILICCFRPICL